MGSLGIEDVLAGRYLVDTTIKINRLWYIIEGSPEGNGTLNEMREVAVTLVNKRQDGVEITEDRRQILAH